MTHCFADIGLAAHALGNLEQAERVYERYIHLQSDDVEVMNNLASIFLSTGILPLCYVSPSIIIINVSVGRIERAGLLLDVILQRRPDHTSALVNLGIIYASHKRQCSHAIPIFRFVRYLVLQHLISRYSRAIAIDSSLPDAWFGLATCLEKVIFNFYASCYFFHMYSLVV